MAYLSGQGRQSCRQTSTVLAAVHSSIMDGRTAFARHLPPLEELIIFSESNCSHQTPLPTST
eukprot:scaffold41204_cov283-Skeletonema_dohrnii-CCMP3373.AAC.1